MEIGETCIQGTCPFRYFLAIRISSFLSRGEFDALWLLVKEQQKVEQILYCLKLANIGKMWDKQTAAKVAQILHWHLVANTGIKSLIK